MSEYENSNFSHMMQKNIPNPRGSIIHLKSWHFVQRHFVLDSKSYPFAATFICEAKVSFITISLPQEIMEHLETEHL